MSIAAGALSIDVKADMTGFTSEVAAGAAAAGQAGSSRLTNAFSRVNLTRVGRNMTMGISLPLAGLGYIATKTAAKFESSMSQTANALGDVNRPMENLEKLALDLGASTIFSAGEVADAMTELAKGGFNEAEISAGALQSTLDLAAAGGIELADAAGMITSAMNTFGIGAADSAQIADALAGAADASAADVKELAWSLTQVGSLASLANQDLTDVTGTLAALAQNGIKGSTAGTTIRSVLTTLIKPTEQASMYMEKYNLQFKDAEGNIKPLPQLAQELANGFRNVSAADRNLALTSIFGTFGLRGAKVLMEEGAKGINEYAAASRRAGAANRAAEARMGPTQRALEELSGAWETLMVVLGKGMAPIIQKIAGALKGMAEALANLPEGVQTGVIAFGALLAAAGPLLMAVGGIASAISKMKALGGASKALCAAGGVGGGCLGQLPTAGKEAGKLGGAIKGLLGPLATALRGIGLVGGGWIAAGLAVAAFVAWQQSAQAEQQKLIGQTKEFQDAVANATSRPLASPGGGSNMDRANMTATKILLDQANATGALAKEQVVLKQSQDAYTNSLMSTQSIAQQVLNGTLTGAEANAQAASAMSQLAGSSRTVLQNMVAAGAPMNQVAAAAAAQRAQFMALGKQMGMSGAVLRAWARDMGLLPKDIRVAIKQAGADEAKKKVKDLDTSLKTLTSQRRQLLLGPLRGNTLEQVKEIEKEIKRLTIQRHIARLELKGGPDSEKQIEKLKAKLEALENKPTKPKVDVDVNGAKVGANIAKKIIDGIKQGAPPKVDVDNAPAKKKATDTKTFVDAIKQKSPFIVDSNTTPAMTKAREAVNSIDAMQATVSIFVEVANPEDIPNDQNAQSLRSGPKPTAPASGSITTPRGPMPTAPANPVNPYPALSAIYNQWLQQYVTGTAEQVAAAQAAIAAAEIAARRTAEDRVTQFQRQQQDQATAQGKVWSQRQAAADAAIADARRAAGDKINNAEEKRIQNARRRARSIRNQIQQEQTQYQRQQDDQATVMQRQLEDQAAAAEAERQRWEDFWAAVVAANEAAKEAARAVQEAQWSLQDTVDSARGSTSDSIQQSIDSLTKQIDRGQIEAGALGDAYATLAQLAGLRDNAAAQEAADAAAEAAKEAAAVAQAAAEAAQAAAEARQSALWAQEDALENAATASADSIKSQIDQLQKAINRGQVEGGVANTDIAQQTIQELWAIYTRTAATETAKAIQDVAGEAAKALAEHRNSIKDKLDSITWVASPNALLRNLRKRTAIIKEYGANLQALQARGLSKEAMAAINEMEPADAAKLTRKLLANPTLVNELNSAYSTLMDQATNTANIQTAQWVATGQSMTDGILAGLRGGTEAVLSYITTLGADALAALKSVLGIASPSKEFMGVGKDVGLGFVQGVESMESRVLASTARLGALPAVSLPEGSVRGGDGAYSAPTFNVYPQPGQSEVEVARQVSRELAWRMT